jgi:hypothetical protein
MKAFRGFGPGVIAALTFTTAVAAVPPQGIEAQPSERAAVARFDAAVADYLTSPRFRDPVSLETLCLPDASAAASAARLDESPPPREGDLFRPELVAVIRTRIAALALPADATRSRAPAVAVGDQLAAGRSARLSRMVAGVLPPVPDDLRYRIAGNDLVLLDLRTNVVVDALRNWRGV